jgi:ectoine hydroxylase-related dioxygenase (phytanoyl-CoA dioxygenase family)
MFAWVAVMMASWYHSWITHRGRTQQQQQAVRRVVNSFVRGSDDPSFDALMRDARLVFRDDIVSPKLLEEFVVQAIREIRKPYGDRQVYDMLRTIADPDCTEGDFDVSNVSDDDDDFDYFEAANVLHKCKILVLRNVFDESFMLEYKANVTAYIRGLHDGRISKEGTTTNGESYFMQKLHQGRWEVLLPMELARSEIVANEKVMKVLRRPAILGPDLVLHSMGMALSDADSKAQNWHTDDDYLFETALHNVAGISQHDLPAYAITMMVPLLSMTPEHGPTDFCIGSSNLASMKEERDDVYLRDETLRPHLFEQPDLADDGDDDSDHCKHVRTPILNFGDVLLFDYQMIHRGGRNVSPDLRAMLYMTFSRFWYKDAGFEDEDRDDYQDEDDNDDEEELTTIKLYKQLTKPARFAIPEGLAEEDINGKLMTDTLGRLEDIEVFEGAP